MIVMNDLGRCVWRWLIWDVVPCSLVKIDQCFGGVYCLCYQGSDHLGYGSSKHLWNIGQCLLDCLVQHARNTHIYTCHENLSYWSSLGEVEGVQRYQLPSKQSLLQRVRVYCSRNKLFHYVLPYFYNIVSHLFTRIAGILLINSYWPNLYNFCSVG
jgi:hypothetical protein